jgi:hypothetical protein
MALIAVASAKGAPGVTTVAVALAAVAPRRAVLADLDPSGGDIALRYPAPDGNPLDPDRGLLSLGAAIRRDPATPFPPHVQLVSGGLEVLVGATSPEQMTALGPVWPSLGRLLRDAPQRDVIADCGRVSAGSPTLPVLQAADIVLFLAGDTVAQLAHLRERLRTLAPLLTGVRLAAALVAPAKRRAAVSDTQRLLEASGLRVQVLGAIADDAKGAGVLQGAESGSAGRTALVKSVRAIVPGLYGQLGQDRQQPPEQPAPSPQPPGPQPPHAAGAPADTLLSRTFGGE